MRRHLVGAALVGSLIVSGLSTAPALAAQPSTAAHPATVRAVAIGDRITAGQKLGPGGEIRSAQGFRLVVQSDGNAVIRDSRGTAVWSSGTSGNPGAVLSLQTDGNVVLRSAAGKAVWTTRTAGSGATALIIGNDGNLVLRNAAGKAVWNRVTGSSPVAAPPVVAPPAPVVSSISTGASLTRNGRLTSPDRRWTFTVQTDGNGVVRGPSGATWTTRTPGAANGVLTLQGDGNLVLRDSAGKARWSSGTSGRQATRLSIQDDGNLVLRTAAGKAVWTSFGGLVAVVPGNPGNSKNCADFSSWRQAQDWFEKYYPSYGDVAKLDADHDGIACEDLPGAP